MSELESGLDTDIEGTVRKKGKGKAQGYRMAIQALREQPLILESVAEDEEAGTALTLTGEQNVEAGKDKDGEDKERVNEAEGTKSTARASPKRGELVSCNVDEDGESGIEAAKEKPSTQDGDTDVNMKGMYLFVVLRSSVADSI